MNDADERNIIGTDKNIEKCDIKPDKKKRMIRFELAFNSILAFLMLAFIIFHFYKNSFILPSGYGFFEVMKSESYADFDRRMKMKLKKVEKDYNESFYHRMDYINAYGYINQLSGRTILDDAVAERSIVRSSEGILYYMMQKRPDTADFVVAFLRLHTFLEQKNIPFVYVQAPNKHMVHSTSFPAGVMDYCNQVSQFFINQLKQNGIRNLNLDEVHERNCKNEKELFYVTDNHWNIHGVFLSYVALIDYLKNLEIGKKLVGTEQTTDVNRYELRTWKGEYIGALGKRVGIGYSDIRDDYEMLFPKFKNDFLFQKRGANGGEILNRSGEFKNVFFFPEYLEKKDIYQEKYTVFMGEGTAEEFIRNNSIENGLNVLVIKDSFAMPIAGFLSQNCESVTLLDIRNFARPRSVEEFVEDGEFDLVLFIASPIGMYFFPEMYSMPNH